MPEIATAYLNPYVIFFAVVFLIVFVRYMLTSKKMATTEMQRCLTQKEQLEVDYHEWMLQADIYFDAEDFSGAFGAASMAAVKAQQLAELKKIVG